MLLNHRVVEQPGTAMADTSWWPRAGGPEHVNDNQVEDRERKVAVLPLKVGSGQERGPPGREAIQL